MKIIGLTGKKESGKTTLMNYVWAWTAKNYTRHHCSFATILKTMLINANICNEEELYYNKTMFSKEMMQKIGTNIIREQMDKDFFCKKMVKDLLIIQRTNPVGEENIVIIDDIRFKNEASLIESIGGVLIRVVRPNWGDPDGHRSEAEMDQITTTMTIFNDSDLQNLERAGRSIAEFIPAFRNIRSSDLIGVDFD